MYEYQNGHLGSLSLPKHGFGDGDSQIEAFKLMMGYIGRHFLIGRKAVKCSNVSKWLRTFWASGGSISVCFPGFY